MGKSKGIQEIVTRSTGDMEDLGEKYGKRIEELVDEMMDLHKKEIVRIVRKSKADGCYSKLDKGDVRRVMKNCLFYIVGDHLWKCGYDVEYD